MNKKCSKCGFEGDSTLFRNRRNVCKKCIAEYNKKYAEENKEKIAEYQETYIEEKKEKMKAYQKRKRKEFVYKNLYEINALEVSLQGD